LYIRLYAQICQTTGPLATVIVENKGVIQQTGGSRVHRSQGVGLAHAPDWYIGDAHGWHDFATIESANREQTRHADQEKNRDGHSQAIAQVKQRFKSVFGCG
jgi:hypothetical protein